MQTQKPNIISPELTQCNEQFRLETRSNIIKNIFRQRREKELEQRNEHRTLKSYEELAVLFKSIIEDGAVNIYEITLF